MAAPGSKNLARGLTAAFFVFAGAYHFINVKFYLGMMPTYLPYPEALIYLSGVCEILGGVGLLIPALRRAAGIGLILLLIAVFPANVTMLTNSLHAHGLSLASVLLIVRLPFQLVFIALVRWVMRD